MSFQPDVDTSLMIIVFAWKFCHDMSRFEFSETNDASFWAFCTFIFKNFLQIAEAVSNGECQEESPIAFWGVHLSIYINIAAFFLNWPLISLSINYWIGSMKPILPHLPHHRFCDLKKVLENKSAKCPERCVICLGKFKSRHVVTELPCEHYYHQACINIWLETHNTCPMCRGVVPDDGWQPDVEDNYLEWARAYEERELERAIDQSIDFAPQAMA
jgi:hypothetical protein